MGRKLSQPEVLEPKGNLGDAKESNEEASDCGIRQDWENQKTAEVF